MASGLKQGLQRCDCCGTEQMARVQGEKLIITDRRHGKRHVLVLPLASLGQTATGRVMQPRSD